MANIELDDNQTQIRDANVHELTIRGGIPSRIRRM